MVLKKIIITLLTTGTVSIGGAAQAQNSISNIGPNNIGQPPQPCIGFNCNQLPPPPGYGQPPQCFPPNVLVRIQDNFGTRFECRFVQAQPVPPVYPVQPPPQYGGGQFSQAHYLYCIARFKSYRQETNTYTSFSGRTKICNSPFN